MNFLANVVNQKFKIGSVLALLSISTALFSQVNTENTSIVDKPIGHSYLDVVGPDNYVLIETKKVPGETVYVDMELLSSLGLVSEGQTESDIANVLEEKLLFEVVRPDEKSDGKTHTQKVSAWAYDDMYLGRGDGRASILFEQFVPGQGTYDIGTKGTGITEYVIPQAAIDADYHIAEKDGLLSMSEAIRTLMASKMLEAFGIESEKVIAIFDTHKETGKNLSPPAIEGTGILIRAFKGGIRGAHLQKYNDEQLTKVGEWLIEREEKKLGLAKGSMTMQEYVENKLRNDARNSARAQHFWVVHGAITLANIFENGWADLNYAEALSVPHPTYSPLNYYSRLNFQAMEILEVSKQFINQLLKVHPEVTIDANKIYFEEFNNHLAELELISAGLKPEVARKLVKKNPELARSYMELVWKINYDHILTDTDALKHFVAHHFRRKIMGITAQERMNNLEQFKAQYQTLTDLNEAFRVTFQRSGVETFNMPAEEVFDDRKIIDNKAREPGEYRNFLAYKKSALDRLPEISPVLKQQIPEREASSLSVDTLNLFITLTHTVFEAAAVAANISYYDTVFAAEYRTKKIVSKKGNRITKEIIAQAITRYRESKGKTVEEVLKGELQFIEDVKKNLNREYQLTEQVATATTSTKEKIEKREKESRDAREIAERNISEEAKRRAKK